MYKELYVYANWKVFKVIKVFQVVKVIKVIMVIKDIKFVNVKVIKIINIICVGFQAVLHNSNFFTVSVPVPTFDKFRFRLSI